MPLKLCISLILVILAGLALLSDFVRPSPIWVLCRLGLCRYDQILNTLSYTEPPQNPAFVRHMLYQDPANPYRWADYADAGAGAPAYDRAVQFGPNLPPILMRAFLFYNARDDRAAADPLAARILTLTPAYDEILFAYGVRPPPQQRPAAAWLHWLIVRASDRELLDAWRWISDNRLADGPNTAAFYQALWDRKAWAAAIAAGASYDWIIAPHPAVLATRDSSGVHLAFSGAANVDYAHLRRQFVLPPGRYTLSIRYSSSGLTTDSRPFLLLSSPSFSLSTAPLDGAATLTLPFALSTPSPLTLTLLRPPSRKFDNKLAGRLHIAEAKLSPAPSGR